MGTVCRESLYHLNLFLDYNRCTTLMQTTVYTIDFDKYEQAFCIAPPFPPLQGYGVSESECEALIKHDTELGRLKRAIFIFSSELFIEKIGRRMFKRTCEEYNMNVLCIVLCSIKNYRRKPKACSHEKHKNTFRLGL